LREVAWALKVGNSENSTTSADHPREPVAPRSVVEICCRAREQRNFSLPHSQLTAYIVLPLQNCRDAVKDRRKENQNLQAYRMQWTKEAMGLVGHQNLWAKEDVWARIERKLCWVSISRPPMLDSFVYFENCLIRCARFLALVRAHSVVERSCKRLHAFLFHLRSWASRAPTCTVRLPDTVTSCVGFSGIWKCVESYVANALRFTPLCLAVGTFERCTPMSSYQAGKDHGVALSFRH